MNMYGGAVAGGSGQGVRNSKYKLYRALTMRAEEKNLFAWTSNTLDGGHNFHIEFLE